MHISIIGTVGVPACYGGFETLVENIIGDNCSQEIEYTIYCSGKSYRNKRLEYKGAKLEYIPFNANGAQSTIYDITSMLKASRKADVLLILGVSGCSFLPVFRIFCRKKIIVNIDGLEHKRDKWRGFAKKILKFSEAMAVKYADTVIADNQGITDYVKEEYGKDSVLIEYGGDHAICDVNVVEADVLTAYQLEKKGYSFSLCRIEPENNVHLTLEAFCQSDEELVFVGNWEKSDYGKELWQQYGIYSNIKMLKPIYQLDILNVLRRNAKFYIHGHSAGGTNPSLVEAMYFGRPIFAFDVVYNRETTENKADYFKTVDELRNLVNKQMEVFDRNADSMLEIASRRYRWSIIARKYEDCFKRMTIK